VLFLTEVNVFLSLDQIIVQVAHTTLNASTSILLWLIHKDQHEKIEMYYLFGIIKKQVPAVQQQLYSSKNITSFYKGRRKVDKISPC
jgi:hypothetical protein